jgi:hypothetical protein
MGESDELVLEDFTDVTGHIDKALDKINTLYKSSLLTDSEKAELGRLGRLIYETNHEMDHFFLSLESVPTKLKDALRAYYAH